MNGRTETNTAFFSTLTDHFFQARKRAAADKQDIGRIDVNKFLIRMFAAALGRNAGNRTFNQFQQGLLHAFAGYVAGNRRVVAFTRDFVDFVNIDDTALGFFDIEIAFTQKLGNNLLNVFTDITRLGQRSRVRHDERHVQFAR